MKVFAISDLHLSAFHNKSMDLFGAHWQNHMDKISEDWQKRVSPGDVVLIPGDISWAMQLREAEADIEAISSLPGKKVILRGNHDYWWSSLSQVRAKLPEGFFALQNDCIRFGNVLVCGSRGWVLCDEGDDPDDVKLYKREQQRLALSIAQAQKNMRSGDKLIAMMHYPPLTPQRKPTAFTTLLSGAGVITAVYGHIHGEMAHRGAYEGMFEGVEYSLVACDYLNFTLKEILNNDGN